MTNEKSICHSGKLRNMASVYIRKGDQVLLLFRQGSSIVSNLWIGSAGGHFEKNEFCDAKACVLRELQEELGMTEKDLQNLTLRYITIRYAESELRQNYYFFADLSDSVNNLPESNEGITRWYSLFDTKNLPMPFTARYMFDHYVSIGQYDTELYGGIANDTGVIFTKL